MATQAEASVAHATIFFRDTEVVLLHADHWQDEDGSHMFRSTEFPFLIASDADVQDAVDQLVERADDFVGEVRDLGDEATDDERTAAYELQNRFIEGYKEFDRRMDRKATRAIIFGQIRRQMRGNRSHRSQETRERSPEVLRA